ncbi:MAG: hypothetical protein GXO67_04580, partial [Archaeoglobi archaeon]|nr:hypothetical protein [Archaeoglobi archaeon]
MRALRVAQILIYNQIRVYRFRKHTILTDALIILSALPVILSPSAGAVLVGGMLEYVNMTVGLERAKVIASSILMALILFNSALNSGKLVVSREHYAIFLHPVSVRDFIFGRLFASAFDFARFSLPLFAFLYALSKISGDTRSALLAFLITLIGSFYLSSISMLFTLLNKRTLTLALAFFSLLDIAAGMAVVSYLIYTFIDALQSCYSTPQLTQFIFFAIASFSLLFALSGRVWIDVEVISFSPKVEVRSSNSMSWGTKPVTELRRMKVHYIPLLAIPAYLIAEFITLYLPSGLPDYFALYFAIPAVSFMDFLARQESSTFWLYRSSDVVSEFAKVTILKAALGGYAVYLPSAAFVYPLVSDLIWIYVSTISLPFMSVICTVLALRDLSKPRRGGGLLNLPRVEKGTVGV